MTGSDLENDKSSGHHEPLVIVSRSCCAEGHPCQYLGACGCNMLKSVLCKYMQKMREFTLAFHFFTHGTHTVAMGKVIDAPLPFAKEVFLPFTKVHRIALVIFPFPSTGDF